MHLNSMVALNRPFHNFTDEDAVVDGKKVYIMRPCMIHGPGNKGNLNLLYGVVSKGITWPLGAFENRRSFTSIGNLQEVIKGLLTKDAPSGIYHMGDDETVDVFEVKQAAVNVFVDKDMIDMFSEYCRAYEEREGMKLSEAFDVDKKAVTLPKKVRTIRLDDIAEINLLKTGGFIERGYDESRGMNYYKQIGRAHV